jgi:hypothetical protein
MHVKKLGEKACLPVCCLLSIHVPEATTCASSQYQTPPTYSDAIPLPPSLSTGAEGVVEDASHLFLMLHFHRKCNTFAHALTTTHTHPPPFPPPPPHVHRSTRCGWRTPHTLREVAGSTTMPSLTWSTQVRTGAQGHYKGTACHGLRQTCTIAMQIGTQTAITNVEYTSMRKATAALRHCAALALAHLQCNALAQLRDGFAHERTCGRAHVHL